jgi:hypothetical protein
MAGRLVKTPGGRLWPAVTPFLHWNRKSWIPTGACREAFDPVFGMTNRRAVRSQLTLGTCAVGRRWPESGRLASCENQADCVKTQLRRGCSKRPIAQKLKQARMIQTRQGWGDELACCCYGAELSTICTIFCNTKRYRWDLACSPFVSAWPFGAEPISYLIAATLASSARGSVTIPM